MGSLIPNQPLIYERVNGVVYARYRDAPNNTLPRWVVGGDPAAVNQIQGDLISYVEWQKLCQLAQENVTLRKQLEKTIELYYLIKENK